ncbi:HAD-IIB family hydrolase [Thermodesulfobacteriota bacterium]
MKPFQTFPDSYKNDIQFVLTDIDDTLTTNGRLLAAVFFSIERLKKANIRIIPITGRPAGWCDHIARMWQIDGLVGENGAFYFVYDELQKKMIRRYWKTKQERTKDRKRLETIKEKILRRVSGCRVASDQRYREADLAIDFCEDVKPLPMEAVRQIERCFIEAGAQAKISSIHVNGWFGDYDKLSMTRRLFEEIFAEDSNGIREKSLFIGDSPNDAPMFAYFPHSVGVANIRHFEKKMPHLPTWITKQKGGLGFAEMVSVLLAP